MFFYVLAGFVAAVVVLMVWVRVAPTDVAFWHDPKLPVMGPGDYPAAGAHVAQRPLVGDGRAELAALDQIIRATPRTRVLAGSVADEKITYVTQTRWMGFPDYTTVTLAQLLTTEMSTVQIYSRLRFGKADLGVNRARIENWLSQWQAVRDAQ
ncbi:DUF1499 domain-containing protein [Octadecabacter sp. G9-8]|uniref:DUF1499 domain-containing protein n=2 Tax=Octadecabacter dasysiphoniae TaxID=2909341 RepID=A0ABS9CZD1_9RHOB|nr:DUF1499 domain-containing protein [Octadecabacter dasysiphoniae]